MKLTVNSWIILYNPFFKLLEVPYRIWSPTLILSSQQINNLQEILLFTSDQMAEQKVKSSVGGFLRNIFPVTVCMVRQLAFVRHEQSSNLTPWLLDVQSWTKGTRPWVQGSVPHKNTVHQKHAEGRQMVPSHVNSDWGLWLPGTLIRNENWEFFVQSLLVRTVGSVCTRPCSYHP